MIASFWSVLQWQHFLTASLLQKKTTLSWLLWRA